MVRKHPHMFLGAQIVVINKIDLAEAMEVSVEDLVERRPHAQAGYQSDSDQLQDRRGYRSSRRNFARDLNDKRSRPSLARFSRGNLR